jgi:hypothetical protein
MYYFDTGDSAFEWRSVPLRPAREWITFSAATRSWATAQFSQNTTPKPCYLINCFSVIRQRIVSAKETPHDSNIPAGLPSDWTWYEELWIRNQE